jgi:hypothetical protein
LGLGATEQCEDGSHSVVLDEPTQGTEWGSPIERQLSGSVVGVRAGRFVPFCSREQACRAGQLKKHFDYEMFYYIS